MLPLLKTHKQTKQTNKTGKNHTLSFYKFKIKDTIPMLLVFSSNSFLYLRYIGHTCPSKYPGVSAGWYTLVLHRNISAFPCKFCISHTTPNVSWFNKSMYPKYIYARRLHNCWSKRGVFVVIRLSVIWTLANLLISANQVIFKTT